MANLVFSPAKQPSFDWVPQAAYPLERRTTRGGFDQSRRTGIRKLRTATLTWKAMSQTEVDYCESFFDQFEGAGGPFDWVPIGYVRSPLGESPTLTSATSGALGARTYNVQFTLGGGAYGETLGSLSSQLAVPANDVLVVTMPFLPNGVTDWRVYAAEDPNPLELQATIQGTRTWQEPDTGLISGANIPASNNLAPPITWLLSGDFRPRKFTAKLWSLTLTFLEQHT